MSSSLVPNAVGQLIWCPQDPSLGVGVITEVAMPRVRVKFLRLEEQRVYTTRGAEHVIIRYEIGANEKVIDQTGQELRVRRCIGVGASGLYTYETEDGREILESELVPNVRDIGAKERLASLKLMHPELVRARMRGLRLANVGTRPGHAAILGARVQWLPHQVDVATRALEHDLVRMLLADEVGLGKTVEAALIYAGLRYEGRAERVLILTPDALCIQWLGELFRKAHELLVLLDDERINDAAQDFPELTPFEAYRRMVASIERVSRDPELAEMALQTEWDLVIVDEAHHLRWQPDGKANPAYQLVQGLAAKSRHLLLLTATPMALDPAEYHALLRLLDPHRFDDPKAFESVAERVKQIRTVAGAIQHAVDNKTDVTPEISSLAMNVLADDPDDQSTLLRFTELKPNTKLRQKRADDVMDALRQRHGLADFVVRNRRGPVGGLPERRPHVFPLVPTEKQDVLLEVGEGVMLELAAAMPDPAEQRRRIGELLRALWATPRALADVLRPLSPELADQLEPHILDVVNAPLDGKGLPTGDARLRWLVETIRALAPREKVLVFVESAIAVRALRDALVPMLGDNVAMFHRGLAPRDQDRQVAWFRDPQGPQVMLSTEAGGEGRNFQFCHHVVLYDMPWRPATIEQRIGRVDRVGQAHDVHILVPYFRGGYEAAILKVMQDSIRVLDKTVGGIDHALEYVSDRLADLILTGAGSDGWKGLYNDTENLVGDARSRIEQDVDTILDHASFSPERVQAVLATVPDDLEQEIEGFVQRYADHSKIRLHAKRNALFAVEGAPRAAGDLADDGYVATFSRTYALDHEEVEFLSFGHPLVQQALEWAYETPDACAALAICRGFARDGAVFLWSYGLDLPEDVPAARAYVDAPMVTFALDEAGQRVPEFEALMTDHQRPLDRMDPSPLKSSADRWRKLVEQNHTSAERLADEALRTVQTESLQRLDATMGFRMRDLKRAHTRALLWLEQHDPARVEATRVEQLNAVAQLTHEHERLAKAIGHARPRLLAAIAVRLMRAKQVSV